MASDPRRQALAALAELSDLAPDLRIGQLVAHLGVLSEDEGGHGLGDIRGRRFSQGNRLKSRRIVAVDDEFS
jgi:hypothetical protein